MNVSVCVLPSPCCMLACHIAALFKEIYLCRSAPHFASTSFAWPNTVPTNSVVLFSLIILLDSCIGVFDGVNFYMRIYCTASENAHYQYISPSEIYIYFYPMSSNLGYNVNLTSLPGDIFSGLASLNTMCVAA